MANSILSKPQSPIHFEEICTLEGFLALEPEWNQLLRRSEADSFFLTWEYVSTWWEVYGKGSTLYLLTARDANGTLVGLAPLMVVRGRGANRWAQVLTFIGEQNQSTSESQDFIALPETHDVVLEGFVTAIKTGRGPKWSLLSFPSARHGSATMRKATILLGQWENLHTDAADAPYAYFPSTWENYLSTRPEKFRIVLHTKTQELQAAHQVALKIGGRDLPMEEALQHLVELKSRGWGAQGKAFQSTQFLEFHRRLIARLAPLGRVSLMVLTIDGRAAAAKYDFIYAGKMIAFVDARDATFAKYSLETVLDGLALRWAVLHYGITAYDFGADAKRDKSEWANGKSPLRTLKLAHPNSMPAKLFLKARGWKRRHLTARTHANDSQKEVIGSAWQTAP